MAKKKLRKRLFLLFKIIVTITLCTIVLWKGDWNQIWNAIQNTNPFLIIIVFICMIFGVIISAFKWQILLSIHGIHYNLGKLNRYYFTSVFFNNFLPSNIGGDVYRIYKTLKNKHSKAGAVVAVFTERVTGIWALLFLGFMGGLILYYQNEVTDIPWFGTMLGIFGCIIFIPLLFLLFLRSTVTWLSRRKSLPQKIQSFFAHFDDYRFQPLKMINIILISLFFHIFTLSWMFMLILAVGANSSIFKLVVAVAISNLAAMLPISINGIGLMDGSFICVMGKLGMSYEPALMVMLLIRFLLIPISLIGGIFYLKDKDSLSSIELSKNAIHSGEESVL